jgi:hypothetical protein
MGSIRVTENATLELKDAVINFTQFAHYQHGIILSPGNTRLRADNVSIVSTHNVVIDLQTNCSASVDGLQSSVPLWLGLYHANLSISESEARWCIGTSSNVTISSCAFTEFELYGDNASIVDSNIGSSFLADTSVSIANSTVGDVMAVGVTSILASEELRANGSLSFHQNAMLHLASASVELAQTHDEELRVTFNDHSHFESTNSAITSSFAFIIYFRGDATGSANGLAMPTSTARLYAFDRSTLVLDGFTSRYLRAFNDSTVTLTNSAPFYLRAYSRASFYIRNSSVRKLYAFGLCHTHLSRSVATEDIRLHNNTYLEATDSTLTTVYSTDTSAAILVNSTYAHCAVDPTGYIAVYWYLDARVVDMIGQPVHQANVSAFMLAQDLKDTNLTDTEGWARLVLLDRIFDHLGEHANQLNYTVRATFEDHVAFDGVNMTTNKVVILELDFIIPEYFSLVIIPLLVTATLVAAWAHKKTKQEYGRARASH